MIGKVMRGRGFAGLARYLESGKTGRETGRVEWIEARNLPTADPQTVSLLMRATAAQSLRVQKPVYHLAISFDPGDPVDRRAMQRVAERVLADLGVGEHQALVVAHRDTGHPHLHVMLNRVHPETGRAWDPKNDYAQIERSLRIQERELGLREVPGHHHALEGQGQPDRSASLSAGQQRQRIRGEIPFVERVRAVAAEDLLESRSWGELEGRLREHGLGLAARGRGMVVTDGQAQAKLSSIARGLSGPKLEARLGPYVAGPAPVALQDAARRADASLDPAVQTLVQELRLYERARSAEQEIRQAVTEAGSAQQEVHALRDAASRADVRRVEFDRALARTHRNPEFAREVFVRAAAEHGAERAAVLMRESPELFGELAEQRRFLGMVRNAGAARENTRMAADAGREYLDARALAPPAERIGAAEQRLAGANQQLRELMAETRLPPLPALERRVGERVAALTSAQREQLQRALPASSLRVLTTAVRLVRDQGTIMER